MKQILSILLILLNINILFAQESFEARILSEKDNKPVSNANISITELQKACSSDENGYFIFNDILAGNYHLKISHLSFNDTVILFSIPMQNRPKLIYLTEKLNLIDEVNITGMRQEKFTEDIPARIEIISHKELNNYPNTNIDNYLQAISNIYVNRSWGIFSKNSSVTMRGMDGTSRVLVLLDGVPLNLSAGGGINWHLIESGQVEKIEVLKGPASALYGNNAMGGVINILTKLNENRFFANAAISGGTYNTLSGKIAIGNNFIKNQKGFYWSANTFYRQGDGYIIVPENERDSTDAKLSLKEYNLNFSTGYQINKDNKIDLSFQFYDDKRDEGIKIYENEGSSLKYTTQQYQGAYTGKVGKTNVYLKSFYHRQDYFQHSERLNETGDSYKLYDRKQLSEDFGFWLNMVRKIAKNNELSYGSDYKHGSMVAEDIYFTSTDYFERGGDINYYALFVQNEAMFFNQKMSLSLGLRADFAEFKNGFLNVVDPTPVTSFDSQLGQKFDNTSWSNLSPKIALKFKINPKLRTYISFSTGFMPPTLDDMVSSRKVNKGFKIANPYLKPEKLYNYEIGIDYKPTNNLKFQTSMYYSIGKDFQYFAHTGDTVDVDKPVVIRENLAKAEIYGVETSVDWKILTNLSLKANYTYNNSQIKKFESKTNNSCDDLTNKYIAETPPHQAYCGLFLTNKIVNFNIVSNYISSMWADEFNSEKLDAYNTIDIRLQKQIKEFRLILNIQNILDNQYIDKKNGLSPGRFIILELAYHFSINNRN